MTDSMLQSYQRHTFTSVVPFEVVVVPPAADALELIGSETDGFAVDPRTYDTVTSAAYVGGPVGGTVAVIDTVTPANNLSNVALDASNLVNSGTSPKSCHFPTSPYVRYSPHNLLLQSQTFGTTWQSLSSASVTPDTATAPDGTVTADTITFVANSLSQMYQDSISFVGLIVYTVSVWAKTASGTKTFRLKISAGGGDVISSDLTATTTWQRFEHFTTASSSTTGNIAIVCNSGGTAGDVIVWGAQLNRGVFALPYLVTTTAARIGIPQSYDAATSKYGILVEPAATNVLLRSEIFGTTWAAENGAIATDNTTAPDANTTAEKYTASNTTAHHDFYQSATLASGATTSSVYVKYSTAQYIRLSVSHNGTAWAAVVADIQGGTITQTNAATYTGTSSTITAIGDGWYRLTLTTTTSGANPFTLIGITDSATPTLTNYGRNSFLAAGTEAVFAWGGQMEAGSVATSYIPTGTAVATRAADNVAALTSSFNYGSANTAYVSAKTVEIATQHDVMEFDANAANEDESVKLYTDSSANMLMQIEDGGATQLVPLDSTENAIANTEFQITGAWATNDVDLSADGTAAQSDVSATMPTVTHVRIGNNPTPGNHLNGFIYKIVHVPRQVETASGNLSTWRYT